MYSQRFLTYTFAFADIEEFTLKYSISRATLDWMAPPTSATIATSCCVLLSITKIILADFAFLYYVLTRD